jgi:serine/threonine protein kinase
MDPARWERFKRIFSEVVSGELPLDSERFLDACGGDSELLRGVRSLAEEHFRLAAAARDGGAGQLPEAAELPRVLVGRYRVLARLGGGSFGDVYRVADEASSGDQLAIKILRSSDPLAIQYFKNEFRSVAGTCHRNIVRLHELLAYDGRLMFTMEFIDGINLLQYIGGCPHQDREARIRSCMLQLAEGLSALHRARVLHRDVKPSNILVTAEGRLVLLDFGLVRAFGEDPHSTATFAGTPDYMSPEQAAGAPATQSSDWYAVGVLLYQCLTGRLPFEGSFVEVLRRKQVETPPHPSQFAEVPAGLAGLCLKLLDRDPLTRGSYPDVVRTLGPANLVPSQERASSPFVGRREPLRRLHEALQSAQDRPTVVHLRGPSGIGKTALLREFVARISVDPSVLVFSGRCYEGVTLPYQALDDLIDHIGHYFRRLPHDRVERLLPRNFSLLVKMFPVLAPFLSNDTHASAILNSIELRTRALVALRELLGRLAERHRIVLLIDDFQWGDVDGCRALNELFSSPDSPSVLVVLAYRSEDAGIQNTLASLAGQAANLASLTIDLDHFDQAESQHLAMTLLNYPPDLDTLRLIAEQAGGSPFLVQEIVRWIHMRGVGPVLNRRFSLTDVIRSRIDHLAADSRQILELVAVAGQPTDFSVLQLAAGLSDGLFARDELVSNRLVRSHTVRSREEIEIYHDRLRETILADMTSAGRIQRHRQLARALESAGAHDPERIASHYEQAQDPHLCARYALMAARRARDVLAFNEAARFFEMALSTGTLEGSERRSVHCECADVLANAGRGYRAAGHYTAACAGASSDEQLEWNLRAAEQLLYSGHVDRGLAICGHVLEQVGIRSPKPRRYPLDLLLRRVRLRLHGIRWRERSPAEISRSTLLKVDTCASVATGLALIDVARGAALQTTGLLLALRAGEPRRIARALAMEAGYRSTAGIRAEHRAEHLLELARELSNRTGDPRSIGLTWVMSAACAWNMGRWSECYNRARSARGILQDRFERLTWERDTACIFEIDALRWMGKWSIMQTILPELIEDARHRGDLYAESILQMHGGSCSALAGDQPTRARDGLKILERWSNTGFHVEHLIELHNQVEIAMYLGNGREAFDLVARRWPALNASLLMRVQALNIQMRSLRARAALSAAAVEPDSSSRSSHLRIARAETRRMARQGAGWGCAIAELIGGCIDHLSGQPERALHRFASAEQMSQSAGMLLHEAVARRCRASLVGGAEGTVLASSANAVLSSEGIVNTGRLSAVMAPGFGA